MRPRSFFVTGTDTDCGKTFVSAALLHKAKQAGLRSRAIKPVAAGCEHTSEGLRNADALALHAQVTEPMRYEEINPLALEPAIAPHLAAEQLGIELDRAHINAHCSEVIQKPHDFCLIEGAGGWLVPLNKTDTLADLAADLATAHNTQALLVVRIKLGCINHALLTVDAIAHSGVTLAGWVANCPQIEEMQQENIATLKQLIKAPCLGTVPTLQQSDVNGAAAHLNLEPIL